MSEYTETADAREEYTAAGRDEEMDQDLEREAQTREELEREEIILADPVHFAVNRWITGQQFAQGVDNWLTGRPVNTKREAA
jgi:hypothetical protein